MKTAETARAEAESIATRWVPAHMTARRGLVDDIAAALLGAALVGYETAGDDARRLVEEAQGDRDKERAAHDFAADVLKTVQAERDRLKGELAEARAMVLDACAAHASDCRCEWCAFLAATPAEQARAVSWRVELDEPNNGLFAQVNARLDALAQELQGLRDNFHSYVDGARINSLHATVAELERRLSGPAPPPPEAAGPGHACDHPKLWCSHPIHAVPPIAGGGVR